MKRSLVIIAVIVLLVVVLFASVQRTYNNMIQKEEQVSAAWAQVENVYQRRLDLIPNLVNTVKGYANFEQQTLTQVIEARAKATSVTIDPTNLNPESLQQFNEAQTGLGNALSRLLVTIERYPDLKANQSFLELQAQLEGTENRIAVERRSFNEVAREYNTYIKQFPRNIYASIFNFESKAYFEAVEQAEQAPKVEF